MSWIKRRQQPSVHKYVSMYLARYIISCTCGLEHDDFISINLATGQERNAISTNSGMSYFWSWFTISNSDCYGKFMIYNIANSSSTEKAFQTRAGT